uniref:Uncharacterized protein n=1 Tax=Oryza brachyantha TaxID=4533 RepID=J3MC82_ORYBR
TPTHSDPKQEGIRRPTRPILLPILLALITLSPPSCMQKRSVLYPLSLLTSPSVSGLVVPISLRRCCSSRRGRERTRTPRRRRERVVVVEKQRRQ